MASCPTTAAAKQVLPQQQLKAPHASAHLLWNICTTSHKPLRLPITHLGPGGAVWSSRCVTGVKDWSLQPFFSLPSPIPAPRRQSKGAEGSCWEQTWHRHLHPGEDWQFWMARLARGTQCAHADCTGSPQQNYSPDRSRAAICSLHSILITLRETLTCRSQCAATSAAQLYRAGGLSSHPFVDWFILLQCSDT